MPIEVAFERDGFAHARVSDNSLKANTQIIIEGNERLLPGQPLMVRNREEAAPEVEQ